MTRTALLTTTGLVLGLAVFTTGCKKNKEVAKPKGEVEIVEFCTGSEYNSDSKHFRSTATGESQDREIVTDNYVSSTEFNNREEATESFIELARTVVDQELRGAIVICEKLTQRENGIYVAYVALELSGEKFASKYNEKISEDERIMAEYNYERFKETFQEEMNKLGN